jgi:LmbE family N-acetylglucosaminyl deacetylase
VISLKNTLIVFAPHPDDETLGCGGTIAKRIAEGYDVFIVVITDGRHAFSKLFRINSNPSTDEMAQIRRTEMIRATKILGVPKENILFLGIEDGRIADNAKGIETKVSEILNEFKPVEIYFPYEGDFHRDHRLASRILQECIKKSSFSVKGYRYSVGQRFSRIRMPYAKLLTRFKKDLTYVDVSKYLTQKAAAINEYKSQTSIICDEQKRPVVKVTSKYLKMYETFWTFNPVKPRND